MNMNKMAYRNIALIAVFGALWGLMEATRGAILHFFHFPFSGLMMTFIVSLFIFPAVKLINGRGAAMNMALIACVIKLFSIGGFKIGPVIAVGMEGFYWNYCFRFLGAGWAVLLFAESCFAWRLCCVSLFSLLCYLGAGS